MLRDVDQDSEDSLAKHVVEVLQVFRDVGDAFNVVHARLELKPKNVPPRFLCFGLPRIPLQNRGQPSSLETATSP